MEQHKESQEQHVHLAAPSGPVPSALTVDAPANKEQVYDTLVAPLMMQIIGICQKHGIAMVASFAIPTPEDADLACSTKLPDGDGNPHPLARALDRWRLGGSGAVALTITTADTPLRGSAA